MFVIYRVAMVQNDTLSIRSSWLYPVSASVGGVVGAILLSIVVYVLHLVFLPSATETEGYPFILLFVFGLGAVLGAVSGLTVGLVKLDRPHQAGRSALVGAFSVAGLIFLASTAIQSGQANRKGTMADLVIFLVTLLGPIIVWIILLVYSGFRLRQNKNCN